MSEEGQRELDRAFAELERELPERIARAVRWVRSPGSRKFRVPLGVLFIAGGMLWFLPVVGLEMLPLGLLIIAQDVPVLQKPVARGVLWVGRRWRSLKQRGRAVEEKLRQRCAEREGPPSPLSARPARATG